MIQGMEFGFPQLRGGIPFMEMVDSSNIVESTSAQQCTGWWILPGLVA